MSTCPCCSDVLLRHIQHGSLYWFCRSCWAEMPNLAEYSDRLAIVTATSTIKPHLVTPARPPILVVAAQNSTPAIKYSAQPAEIAA
jgi:hypothetical protein